MAGPKGIEHDKELQESQGRQLVVKEVWNHNIAPLYGDVTGALYAILGPVELSAVERYIYGPARAVKGLSNGSTRFGTDAVIYPASE